MESPVFHKNLGWEETSILNLNHHDLLFASRVEYAIGDSLQIELTRAK